MKKILLKLTEFLTEFYESLDWIDKGSIILIVLLSGICLIAYLDIRKLDKKIDDDKKFIEKKYGRLK